MNHPDSANPNHSHTQALINGRPDLHLSLFDRGLAYGDGVFRTFPVQHGKPQHWALQYKKLASDCAVLNIECPSQEALLADIQTLFDAEDGVAKIIVTRGESVRGYGYPSDIKSNRIVLKQRSPEYPPSNREHGVHLYLCDLRLSHQPKLAGIKHLNRLENVLARAEWNDFNIADGVLLDVDGNVIECTMSNIFARFGDQLLTPLLNHCGVAGVTRERILNDASRLNLQAKQANISLTKLMQADEIIICNSLFGAWQVIEFNHKYWKKQPLADQLTALLAS